MPGAPFYAFFWRRAGEAFLFETGNTFARTLSLVAAGSVSHAVRNTNLGVHPLAVLFYLSNKTVLADPRTGEPRPYLHVRRGLEARIRRPVFYELVEMAQERDAGEGPQLGVWSNGAWFPVGPAGAHLT